MRVAGLLICVAIAFVVTIDDIQIRFPTVISAGWQPVDLISIEYSPEPVGEHSPKGKLGIQIWEALLQEDEPELGKVVMKFELGSLPSPNDRVYEFHFRVRDDVDISVWSENFIKIIGNPGIPSNVQ